MMQCCISNAKGVLNYLLPWRPLCLAELLFFTAWRQSLLGLQVSNDGFSIRTDELLDMLWMGQKVDFCAFVTFSEIWSM